MHSPDKGEVQRRAACILLQNIKNKLSEQKKSVVISTTEAPPPKHSIAVDQAFLSHPSRTQVGVRYIWVAWG